MSENLDPNRKPTWTQLESVKSLAEAEEITSLSRDTLVREYRKYIVRLSARRLGMKFRHVLAIAAGELV